MMNRVSNEIVEQEYTFVMKEWIALIETMFQRNEMNLLNFNEWEAVKSWTNIVINYSFRWTTVTCISLYGVNIYVSIT